MHLAICIWGLMRSIQFTINTYHTHILRIIHGYGHTYEVFVHTYNFSHTYINPRNNESGEVKFDNWKLLQPNYIYIEDQDDFDQRINGLLYQSQGDPWVNDFHSFQNHLRSLNSLHHVTMAVESMSKHVHYDGIIFLRPDVRFLHTLPIFLLEEAVANPWKSQSNTGKRSSSLRGRRKACDQTLSSFPSSHILFLPDFHRACKGGEYNDRMAMGDLHGGLFYGKKLQKALIYSLVRQLHSEVFTHEYLRPNAKNIVTKQSHSLDKGINNDTISQNISLWESWANYSKPTVEIVEMPFRFRRVRITGAEDHRDNRTVFDPYQPKPGVKADFISWIYGMFQKKRKCAPNLLVSVKKTKEIEKCFRGRFNTTDTSSLQSNRQIRCKHARVDLAAGIVEDGKRSLAIIPKKCHWSNQSTLHE
eukprot:gene821-891_t